MRTQFIRFGQVFLGLFSPVLAWWLAVAASADASENGGSRSGHSNAFYAALGGQLIWALGLAFSSGNLAAFEVICFWIEKCELEILHKNYLQCALLPSCCRLRFGLQLLPRQRLAPTPVLQSVTL